MADEKVLKTIFEQTDGLEKDTTGKLEINNVEKVDHEFGVNQDAKMDTVVKADLESERVHDFQDRIAEKAETLQGLDAPGLGGKIDISDDRTADSGGRYYLKMKYAERQFLRARDFQDEQSYHIRKLKDHNRTLHVYGICEGLIVDKIAKYPGCVTVSPGSAVDADGNSMTLDEIEIVDLSAALVANGVYESAVNLFIRYDEANASDAQYKVSEGGFEGTTRIVEKPKFYLRSAGTSKAADIADNGELLLAAIVRNANGSISGVASAPDGRRTAGVRLEVNEANAIANGVVQARHLAEGAALANIADGAITGAKLASDAVTNDAILDNSITGAKIADGTIHGAKLGSYVVTNDKIADSAITSVKLTTGTALANINAGTITSAKLASNAVTNSNIADNTINGIKIADGTITTAKLINGAISSAKLADGSVSIDKTKCRIIDHGTMTIAPHGRIIKSFEYSGATILLPAGANVIAHMRGVEWVTVAQEAYFQMSPLGATGYPQSVSWAEYYTCFTQNQYSRHVVVSNHSSEVVTVSVIQWCWLP